MTEPSTTTEFLDSVAAALRDALAALDAREATTLSQTETDRQPDWADTLSRLEGNLSGWEGILGNMADQVRAAQDDLALLDADLRRSLDTFSVARKHLQGSR
jgi:hypothetical protein